MNINTKRMASDKIIEFVEFEGYTIISGLDEYKNNKSIINMICPNGHQYSVSWNKFKSGRRCNCKQRDKPSKTIGKKKLIRFSYEEVHRYFELNDCKLLSESYRNTGEKLSYICQCDTISEITFESFKNGHRCNNCRYKQMAETRKTPYENIQKLFSDNGCILLTTPEEYKGVAYKVKYLCVCGKEKEITPHNHKHGRTCDECKWVKRANTLFINGNAPCSKQQRFVHSVIGGELNYPQGKLSLDIAFPDEKIYVECDFGGHWLQIKFGNVTEIEFVELERKRFYALSRNGWNEIRIISKSDKVPNKEKLSEMITFAKEYLSTGRHLIRFDIDKGIVKTTQFESHFDYGKLKLIN